MAQHKILNYNHFIENQPEEIVNNAILLNNLFMSYPNVGMKIRFNIPFYDYKTWICYFNPLKKQKGAELVFLRGKILQETFPFLEDKGRKMVAGIRILEMNDELLEQIIMVWEEALTLEK